MIDKIFLKYLFTILILICVSCVKDSSLDSDDPSFIAGLIAFTAYEDSSMSDLDIYLVNSYDFTPEPVNVSNDVAVDCYPEWLHNKSGLVYISSSGVGSSIMRVNTIGYDRYSIFTSDELILQVSASPVDPILAYYHIITGQQNVSLNILNIETLDTLQLNNFSSISNLTVAWSKDGQKLAVKAGVILVYETQQWHYLYNFNYSGEYFAWDETGEGLYMIRSGDLIHADTLQEHTILADMSLAYPSFSPDRRSLACISRNIGNSLIVIDLSFGDYINIRQIQLPQFECSDYRLIDWSADSREISFIDFDGNSWNIYTASRESFHPVDRVTYDESIKKAISQ